MGTADTETELGGARGLACMWRATCASNTVSQWGMVDRCDAVSDGPRPLTSSEHCVPSRRGIMNATFCTKTRRGARSGEPRF